MSDERQEAAFTAADAQWVAERLTGEGREPSTVVAVMVEWGLLRLAPRLEALEKTPTDSAVPEPADPPSEGPKVVGYVTKPFAESRFPASQIKWQMEGKYEIPVILQSDHEAVVRGLEDRERQALRNAGLWRDAHETLQRRAEDAVARLMEHWDDNRRLRAENERLREERDAYADPENWEVKVPTTVAMHMASNAFHDLAPQTIHQAIKDAVRRVTITPTYVGPTPSDSTEPESVEGQVVRALLGSWGVKGSGRCPWPTHTPVRITRIPGGDDGDNVHRAPGKCSKGVSLAEDYKVHRAHDCAEADAGGDDAD